MQNAKYSLSLKSTTIRLAARTHWGSLCTPPDPLATVGCLLLREGEEGPTSKGDAEGKEGRREGTNGEGKGVPPPPNVIILLIVWM